MRATFNKPNTTLVALLDALALLSPDKFSVETGTLVVPCAAITQAQTSSGAVIPATSYPNLLIKLLNTYSEPYQLGKSSNAQD